MIEVPSGVRDLVKVIAMNVGDGVRSVTLTRTSKGQTSTSINGSIEAVTDVARELDSLRVELGKMLAWPDDIDTKYTIAFTRDEGQVVSATIKPSYEFSITVPHQKQAELDLPDAVPADEQIGEDALKEAAAEDAADEAGMNAEDDFDDDEETLTE